MKCPNCGCLLPEDSEFCQYCGVKVGAIADSDVVVSAEQEPMKVDVPSELETVENEAHMAKAEDRAAAVDADELAAAQGYADDAPEHQVMTKECEAVSPAEDEVTAMGYEPSEQDCTSPPKKERYCKRCGGLIDWKTKKCRGCGKQYFRPKIIIPAIFVTTLCLLLAALNVVQFIVWQSKEADYNAQLSALETTVATKTDTIYDLNARVKELWHKNYVMEKSQWKVDAFEQILSAASSDTLGYASNNFHASESLIVVPVSKNDRKFTLTANWSSGGSVSVDYSTYAAGVRFDKDSWTTSTSMTIVPHYAGVTVVTFGNNVNSATFKIIIIVTG